MKLSNYLSTHTKSHVCIDHNFFQGCRKFGKISDVKKFIINSRYISPSPLPSYTMGCSTVGRIADPSSRSGPIPTPFSAHPFFFPFPRTMPITTDPSRALGCR